VGLYLDPPTKAVVVCIDEKTQIQALDRTAPILPDPPRGPREADFRLRPQRDHDAVRGAGDRDGPDHRPLLLPAHERPVPGVPETGRPRLSAGSPARGL
jgi:hypothetical protein